MNLGLGLLNLFTLLRQYFIQSEYIFTKYGKTRKNLLLLK